LPKVWRFTEKIDTNLRRDTRFENVKFIVNQTSAGTIYAEIPLIKSCHDEGDTPTISINTAGPERSYELT
jgi:hypothetical protein